jgi:hypothetical protein
MAAGGPSKRRPGRSRKKAEGQTVVVSRLAITGGKVPGGRGGYVRDVRRTFLGRDRGGRTRPVPKTVADTLQSPTSQSTEWDQPQFASDASEDAARIPPRGGDGLSVQ